MSALAAQMSTLSLGAPTKTVTLKSFEGFKASGMPVVNAVRTAGVSIQAAARRTPLKIMAARVAGVEIPNAKRIETALTYVYGIGPKYARDIMATTGLENKRTGDLAEEELKLLRDEIENMQIMVEGDLRRFNELNIKRLKDIQCYRGRRHIMGLPVRGQKSKTNARTRKGKKVAIAGKKKAPTAR